MNSEYARQVLLVEDQSFQYQTLLRRMKEAGYAVTLAKDYVTARQLLETSTFHLAIVDICLDRTAGENEDGLHLLEDMKTLGLRGAMPAIVLTAYSTEDRVLRAKEDLEVTHYIRKKSGYIAEVLNKVNAVFHDEVGINFELQYEGNSPRYLEECADDIYKGETQLPPAEQLESQIRDLMGRLFFEAERLRLKRMPQGLSGSAVLQAQPTYRDRGLGQWLIVKVGRRGKTEIEAQNYHACIEHFLPANHTTQLTAHYTRHLGGLLYTLNIDAAGLGDFIKFYHEKSVAKIVTALKNLFHTTCALWYQNRVPPRNQNLRDIYFEAFDLQQQPERIPNEIAAMRPDIDWQADQVPLSPTGIMLPNPLRWLAADNDEGLLPVSICVTHGDLHAGNILINSAGECWLIDFLRTRRSHMLRDIVKLEVDIKFNLLEPLSLEDYAQFEQALLQAMAPGKRVDLFPAASAAAHKAADVIAGLRNEAWLLLDWQRANELRQVEMQKEYLFALLMTTLNVLRLRHYKEDERLRPYRDRALLSAALICREMERLNQGR